MSIFPKISDISPCGPDLGSSMRRIPNCSHCEAVRRMPDNVAIPRYNGKRPLLRNCHTEFAYPRKEFLNKSIGTPWALRTQNQERIS